MRTMAEAIEWFYALDPPAEPLEGLNPTRWKELYDLLHDSLVFADETGQTVDYRVWGPPGGIMFLGPEWIGI